MTEMTEQDARNDSRVRIVTAAASLLRERGPDAVTTRGVAEAAGVQAPTIYRLFGDKDGLLDAVAEHVMQTFVANKAAVVEAAALENVDPLDDLHAGWQAQIEFGTANPALFGLLSDPARALHSPAARSGRQVLEARVHRIALAGRLRVSERRAADLIAAAGIGTITTILATPVEQRDPGLADAMWAAVLQQIVIDSGPRGTSIRPTAGHAADLRPEAAPATGVTPELGATSAPATGVAPELGATSAPATGVAPEPDLEPAALALATTVTFRAFAPKLTTLTASERLLLLDWLDREIAAH